MTDRHLHCVYFQYDDPNSVKGFCLLKQKEIEFGFKPHCEDYILRPEQLLSHFLMSIKYCKYWECADRKATEYIEKYGVNTYPKVRK